MASQKLFASSIRIREPNVNGDCTCGWNRSLELAKQI